MKEITVVRVGVRVGFYFRIERVEVRVGFH